MVEAEQHAMVTGKLEEHWLPWYWVTGESLVVMATGQQVSQCVMATGKEVGAQ